MLTPPQVAKQLGVNPDKIRYWIISGELKASNIALTRNKRPQYVISEADLAAFLERREVVPAPAVVRKPRRKLSEDTPDHIGRYMRGERVF